MARSHAIVQVDCPPWILPGGQSTADANGSPLEDLRIDPHDSPARTALALRPTVR